MREPPGPDLRPVSYATRDDAAAYVVRLADPVPPVDPAAPVYLIAAPFDRESDWWRYLVGVVARLLPGPALVAWEGVPSAHGITDPAARSAALVALHRGAVVVPHRLSSDRRRGDRRRLIGRAAQREAESFAAAGRPVLVTTGRRLVAWPDVNRVKATAPYPGVWPIEIGLPAPPPAPLPTMAASFRALGLSADLAERASVGIAERHAQPALCRQ